MTLRAIHSIFAQTPSPNVTVWLTDDGCTDGTVSAVVSAFPQVRVIEGDGHLYWAAGMALAEAQARRFAPDFLLWMNDDVVLDTWAIRKLLQCAQQRDGSIIVGALRDPHSGLISYGGRQRVGSHPLRFRPQPATNETVAVDAFNGNCVLIPKCAYDEIGPIDGQFAHAFADDDYSLRATRSGIHIFQVDGFVGVCMRERWVTETTSLVTIGKILTSPLGLPGPSLARYLRRHSKRFWPYLWIRTRLSFLVKLSGLIGNSSDT